MYASWANWFHGPNWCDMSEWINANWATWFHRPNWRAMSYWCHLGQLDPSAQLARYVLCMPIGPFGSTGPIGAICPNELMPIGPIGSIGPIGEILLISAIWANWFHGPNWCDMSQWINANWANWFHRPNWRDMSCWCQLGQLVPADQLARYVLLMPIGPIGTTGPIGAICPIELMPIGPIGSIGPVGAIWTIYANWANWFHGPNWCDLSQWIDVNWANWFHRPNWRDMSFWCHLGQWVPRAQMARYVLCTYGSTGPIGGICPN